MYQSAQVLIELDEPELIEKEKINALHFEHDDVLDDLASRRRRAFEIERACALGNTHHCKVQIYFRADGGHLWRADTTIWACDSQYITLKAGASIPVRAIVGIEFL